MHCQRPDYGAMYGVAYSCTYRQPCHSTFSTVAHTSLEDDALLGHPVNFPAPSSPNIFITDNEKFDSYIEL
jgi:hypothetical protein